MPTRDVWAKQSLMGGGEEQVYLDGSLWELAVLLVGEAGKVCVEQTMGHLVAGASPPSAYPIRCPEQPHSAFGDGGGNKGNSSVPLALSPCLLDNPTLPPPHHLLLQRGI